MVRYGPGVPASQAAAQEVWRTGRPAGPPPGRGKPRRGLGLTVLLLAAAGVVVWLRLFDHAALQLTGVTMKTQPAGGCAVNVTATITTNGAAGIIAYQWEFQPQTEAPQQLSQSVTAGQHSVDVTIAIEGQGHGSAAQRVTLDVYGPQAKAASMPVNLSC